AVVPWVGRRVLRLDYEVGVVFNGSGDRTYDYILVLCLLALAAAATLAWTLLDRRRTAYTRLHQWLRVYVRLYLGTVMIGYGAVKVINTQFPRPPLDRLVQPFGDASPMGLLWTFMGASEPYTMFTGAAEMLCGVLLFARRTTTLGALLTAGVMGNVAMLNFSYDVPVKIFSLHLLALAVFLTVPDARRLADVFLLNRASRPAEVRPLFAREWLNRAALVLRTLFLVSLVGLSLYQSYEARQASSARSPLYGVWEVEEFSLDGEARPPLITEQDRWRRVIFDYPGVLAVQLMSDTRQRYRLVLDAGQKTLSLTKRDDPNWKTVFTYEQPEPERLALAGALDGRAIQARLRRTDPSRFLLRSRGFNWINEFPFNR
ncbi:MAG TPA: hypothetical protein VEQ42_00625, partial [Pyrinomonadaceae bacterium]|nr:hypothetical protein [Pyrinomonadaceae bacterium]